MARRGRFVAHRLAVRGFVVLLAVVGVSAGLTTPQLPASVASAATPQGFPVVLDGAVTGFAVAGPPGDRLVVVIGTFTQLRIDPVASGVPSVVVNRSRVFAYDQDTGLYDPAFLPSPNGRVLAVAGDDTGVYLGGDFTEVNGTPHRKLARVLLADGAVDPAFRASADNRVQAMALDSGRLFVGGQFTEVDGRTRTRLAQLDAATGAVAKSFTLALRGTAAAGGVASVQSLAVSPDHRRLLVAHTAQTLAGQPRYGVGLVDVSGATATLDPWRTNLWRSRLSQTGGLVRVTSAAWGPNSRWFVVTNTGGDVPPINDCVQRFDIPPSPTTDAVAPTWVTRMFDSSYASAVGPDGTVYVGGHFQFTEAPGAADPYPGDPDVNYGGGLATQGARTLGQQVVNRRQVAALDPATGHATNWWSSAAGHKGVTALMVVEPRVLIGSDGAWVDDVRTGRAGSSLAADAPAPSGVALPGITSPVNGANLDVGPLTVTGTATAPNGVANVQVEVKQGNRYLQADGTWDRTYRAFPALVASPGSKSSAWSLDLVLPEANDYVLYVRAFDSVLGKGPKQKWHVLTNDPTNAPPSTFWTSPKPGQSSFPGHTFTVRGTANDPDGVADVSLTFYNQDLHSYVSATGKLDPFVASSALLASPGAAATTWSLEVTLPDGHYTASAKGTDGAGTSDPRGNRLGFSLFPGNRPPSVTVSAPTADARVGAFRVRGKAADDHGVARVIVKVADLRYGQGAQAGGGYGVAGWLPTTLSHPGRKDTAWSVRVPRLPVGTYRVTAVAVDRSGVRTPASRQAHVTVRRWPTSATREPATRIVAPVTTDRFDDRNIPLSGTASYGPGLDSVTYSLFDTKVGRYLQGDGSFAKTPHAFPASGTGTWSATAVVPYPGTWRVDAVAHGSDGMVDSTPTGSRVLLYVYPGDDDPSVTVGSPRAGASFAKPRAITVSGRAFDDVGVLRVQVLVRNRTGTLGLRPGLTLGKHPSWVDAFVTNVGGVSSNYNLVTPVLPKGRWTISVRAVDSVGKPQADPVSVNIRIR